MATSGPVDRDKLFGIYLDDHWAGAAAGLDLANRLASRNQSMPWHGDLTRIVTAIREDQEVLGRLRDRRGRPRSTLKRKLAVVATRIGGLKLNGRLATYSPLSRVIELEVLMAGVQAKQLMWRTLRQVEWVPSDISLDDLERRAEEQLEQLDRIHDQAAQMAFASPATGA
jgi:hypothetical protein